MTLQALKQAVKVKSEESENARQGHQECVCLVGLLIPRFLCVGAVWILRYFMWMHCVEDEENRELAVIYLQQVLRGRSLQETMYDGMEKRAELIRELRSTHALRAAEQQVLQDDRQATMLLQQQQQLNEIKVRWMFGRRAQLLPG